MSDTVTSQAPEEASCSPNDPFVLEKYFLLNRKSSGVDFGVELHNLANLFYKKLKRHKKCTLKQEK